MPNVKLNDGRVVPVSDADYEKISRAGLGAEETHFEGSDRGVRQSNEQAFDTLGNKVLAFGEGALSAGTLGISDILLDDQATRLRAEYNPGSRMAGEIVGSVAPAFASGGSSLVAKAVMKSPAGMLFRGGEKLAGIAGATKGGLVASGVANAVEGAGQGLGATVSHAALSDDPFTVEAALEAMGRGGAIAGGMGLLGGAISRGATRLGERAAARQAERATADALVDGAENAKLVFSGSNDEFLRIKDEFSAARDAIRKDLSIAKVQLGKAHLKDVADQYLDHAIRNATPSGTMVGKAAPDAPPAAPAESLPFAKAGKASPKQLFEDLALRGEHRAAAAAEAARPVTVPGGRRAAEQAAEVPGAGTKIHNRGPVFDKAPEGTMVMGRVDPLQQTAFVGQRATDDTMLAGADSPQFLNDIPYGARPGKGPMPEAATVMGAPPPGNVGTVDLAAVKEARKAFDRAVGKGLTEEAVEHLENMRGLLGANVDHLPGSGKDLLPKLTAASDALEGLKRVPDSLRALSVAKPETLATLNQALAHSPAGAAVLGSLNEIAEKLGVKVDEGGDILGSLHSHLQGIRTAEKAGEGVKRAVKEAEGGGGMFSNYVGRKLGFLGMGAVGVAGGPAGLIMVAAEVSGARAALTSKISSLVAKVGPKTGKGIMRLGPAVAALRERSDGSKDRETDIRKLAMNRGMEIHAEKMTAADAGYAMVEPLIGGAIGFASAFQMAMVAGADVMARRVPKDPGTAQVMLSSEWEPTEQQAWAMAEELEASRNPMQSIARQFAGEPSPVASEVLWETWPGIMSAVQAEFLSQVPMLAKKIPYDRLIGYATVLRVPEIDTLNSKVNIAALQALHAPKPVNPGAGSSPPSPPSTDGSGLVGKTQAQKLQA